METHARQRIQGWLQDLLEAEVTQFLGRAKSQRRLNLFTHLLTRPHRDLT
jgi:hypothetical protein